jgi:hypothetical protein
MNITNDIIPALAEIAAELTHASFPIEEREKHTSSEILESIETIEMALQEYKAETLERKREGN